MFDKTNIIPIAADHGGFEMKEYIVKRLKENGYQIKDYGAFSTDSVDYPDVIHPIAEDVAQGKYLRGIILCGSGEGAMIVANKHKGIRAGLCWNKELAMLIRQHNNANIMSLPGRFIDFELAFEMVEVFLNTEFEGGRHEKRVEKIEK